MENKTVEMVVKDLLLADNRKKKKKKSQKTNNHILIHFFAIYWLIFKFLSLAQLEGNLQ